MIRRTFLLELALLVFCLLSPQERVEAAEFFTGVEVHIGSDDVIDADVYAIGGQVLVDGTINGDLVAASEGVLINGTVNGDLIVAARSIRVNGAVQDDIRAAGAELQFRSTIGGDLIVAGDQIDVVAGSVVGEDLVVGANTLTVGGEVQGNVDLNAVEVSITGRVQGNVNADVEERLVLNPESRIEGALNYTSQIDVTLEPGAEVGGEVTRFVPMVEIFGSEYPVSMLIQFVASVISQVKWFIGTLLVGLILIWLFPNTMQQVVTTLSVSPWKSMVMGVLVFPLAAILLLLTMIVVLSIIGFAGFPIIAMPALVYAMLLLLAKPAIAMVIGDYVVNRVTQGEGSALTGALATGAAILAVIGLIPYLDRIVGWFTLLAGLGMWVLFGFRSYGEARAAQNV